MTRRVIVLCCLLSMAAAILAPAGTVAPASPGISVEYTVTVTPLPNPSISVRAVYSGLTTPLRLAVGFPSWPGGSIHTLDLIQGLALTAPDGRPISHRQTDANSVVATSFAPTVVAMHTVNLQVAKIRGDKLFEHGGKISGLEAFLIPSGHPLASARVRFIIPEQWQLVSVYPQEGPWTIVKPQRFADLTLELVIASWFFGVVDFDHTRTYPDGFRARVVSFEGQPYRTWDVYRGHSTLEEALLYADFYHRTAQKYRTLFGEFLFEEVLILGPGFWQVYFNSQIETLRGTLGFDSLPHHILHAFFWGFPNRIVASAASLALLGEGIATYAEGIHTAEISGNDKWRGMLFERAFHYLRGPQLGNSDQSWDHYVAGTIIAFMVDERIRNATGGTRGIDDLLGTLWRKYSAPNPVWLTDDMLLTTLRELTGQDWRDFYQAYMLRTDNLDVGPLTRAVKPYFPLFLREIAAHWYQGHPSAYFVQQELVSAAGHFDSGVRFHSPFLAYTGYKNIGHFAVVAHQHKDLSQGDLTEADIIAILNRVTGKDHRDFFTFYRGLGLTVDPACISEYVRTFSYKWDAADNAVRLTPRGATLATSTKFEAEIVDPDFMAHDEFWLQVHVYAMPRGIQSPRDLVTGEGVQVWYDTHYPNGSLGPMHQVIFRLPRRVVDGRTFVDFTLNLGSDAGVIEYVFTAMSPTAVGANRFHQDLITIPVRNNNSPVRAPANHRGVADDRN